MNSSLNLKIDTQHDDETEIEVEIDDDATHLDKADNDDITLDYSLSPSNKETLSKIAEVKSKGVLSPKISTNNPNKGTAATHNNDSSNNNEQTDAKISHLVTKLNALESQLGILVSES